MPTRPGLAGERHSENHWRTYPCRKIVEGGKEVLVPRLPSVRSNHLVVQTCSDFPNILIPEWTVEKAFNTICFL